MASLLELRQVLSKHPSRPSKNLYLNPEDKPDRKVLTVPSGSHHPFSFSSFVVVIVCCCKRKILGLRDQPLPVKLNLKV